MTTIWSCPAPLPVGKRRDKENKDKKDKKDKNSGKTTDPAVLYILTCHSAAAVPITLSPAPGLSRVQYDNSQVANRPRLPWAWPTRGKTSDGYTPVERGKWWSMDQKELDSLT
jgi:hypothetical protein